MAGSTTCVFCELIASGTATWLARDELAVSFLPPAEDTLAPGHALVVPVEHSVGVIDASPSSLAATIDLVQRVSQPMTSS